MNTEPQKNSPSMRSRMAQLISRLPGGIVRFFTQNWQWKLAALFMAVCLWAGLISQDATLTRERVFNDVPISVNGADSLRRNSGLIVVGGLDAEALKARMRVDVPQREYSTVAAANYNPRVELTRITEPGEQTLKVYTTSTTTYGSVQDISPSTITVMVDEYVTNYRVPVSISISGEYPEGFYGTNPSLDPSMVAVSGPKTIVDQIANLCVYLDLSILSPRSGNVRIALPIQFMDRDGNVVESDLLEVTSADVVLRTIIVDQTLYPTRTLPLSGLNLVTGEPAEGYRIESVSVSPESITIAGSEEALENVEQLFADSEVDVSGAEESVVSHVRVRRPPDIRHLSPDTIVVEVEIVPEQVSRTFDSVRLSAHGTGSGLKVSLERKNVALALTGPQPEVKGLRSSDITAYVDVTGLDAGEYELPVEFLVEEADLAELSFLPTPATVLVTLAEK